MHQHIVLRKTVPGSMKSTDGELVASWNRARIPVAYQADIILKIKGLDG